MSFQKTPSREDIERRAFQIYMAGGRQPGNDYVELINSDFRERLSSTFPCAYARKKNNAANSACQEADRIALVEDIKIPLCDRQAFRLGVKDHPERI